MNYLKAQLSEHQASFRLSMIRKALQNPNPTITIKNKFTAFKP